MHTSTKNIIVQDRAQLYPQLQILYNGIALKRGGSWWNIKMAYILTCVITGFGHLF